MIENVCIHVTNEQPLLCDLYEMPSSDDAGLVCTNVRSMDGKRPIFIDHVGSTFFFPYHVVRFLEIPEASMAAWRATGGRAPAVAVPARADLDVDDANGSNGSNGPGTSELPGSLLPVVTSEAEAADDDDLDVDLEIDEDFLQRVRDL